jgi:hypothetical protein
VNAATQPPRRRHERALAGLLERPWLLLAFVLVLWLVIGFGPLFFVRDAADRGQLGDMFGMANALFSGLALAGVVWAILLQSEELKLQRKELALQRKELEETRAELKRSATAHENSASLLSQQLSLQRLSVAPLLSQRAALRPLHERWELLRSQPLLLEGRLDPAERHDIQRFAGDLEAIDKDIGQPVRSIAHHAQEISKLRADRDKRLARAPPLESQGRRRVDDRLTLDLDRQIEGHLQHIYTSVRRADVRFSVILGLDSEPPERK